MEMSKYVRLTKGLSDKGVLIEPDKIYDYITTSEKDWYVSIFKYTQKQYEQFKQKGTVSGIEEVVTNKLVFDFDNKNDLELAKTDTLEMIERLKKYNINPESIEIYFSGNKGFTVQVNFHRNITPKEAKHIAVVKLGRGLTTLDPSIYNASRILRVPGTKHPESGLYKIPLSHDDIKNLSIENIKIKASDLNSIPDEIKIVHAEPNEDLFKMEEHIEQQINKVEHNLDFDLKNFDMSNKPSHLDEARWLLMNGFFRGSQTGPVGERSNALLCLASTYKNQGYDKQHVYRLLKGVAELQSARTGEDRFPDKELYNNIILQVYGDNWRGGQFTVKDETNWLHQYAKKMGVLEKSVSQLMTVVDARHSFINFVKNIEKNTILTGIKSLDEAMPITVGSNIGIVAPPGIGKTAYALEVLKNTSQAGVHSVFASLDMSRNRLFEKLLYKVTGIKRDELYKLFKDDKYEEAVAQVKASYENVWFYDRSSATVSDIRDYILNVEKTTGNKIKLLMVDYFERVNSDYSDETASSKKVAGELQDLIQDLDIAVITLCQPNKMSLGSGPDKELQSYTAIKGSSFLYQSFRGIVSLSRPFFHPKTTIYDKYLRMNILKNDLGELGTLDFKWNGFRGEISSMEDFEKEEFYRLLSQKKSMIEDEDGEKNDWQ